MVVERRTRQCKDGRINKGTGITFEIDESNLTPSVGNAIKTSVGISNIGASSGGMGAESVEELRENIAKYLQNTKSMVTKDDYIVRTYAS